MAENERVKFAMLGFWWTAVAVGMAAAMYFAGANARCNSLVAQAQHANQVFVAEWVKTSEACQ